MKIENLKTNELLKYADITMQMLNEGVLKEKADGSFALNYKASLRHVENQNYDLKQKVDLHKKLVNDANELLGIQGQKGNFDNSDYMLGMYNGMELIVAVMEQRKPKYRFKNNKKNKIFNSQEYKKMIDEVYPIGAFYQTLRDEEVPGYGVWEFAFEKCFGCEPLYVYKRVA